MHLFVPTFILVLILGMGSCSFIVVKAARDSARECELARQEQLEKRASAVSMQCEIMYPHNLIDRALCVVDLDNKVPLP